MKYTVTHIAGILGAKASSTSETMIGHLLLDSRRIYSPSGSLFFALRGPRRDGHQFIREAYRKGVRNFVVSDKIDPDDFPDAVFLFVPDGLAALQALAAWHRRQFDIPVIGITGSNGKTIVKEWLYQLLHADYPIVRSPRSFNSQIGVPLSVWQMNPEHRLGIFEAGISQPGEMENLEKIIQPTIGVLTNIGEAHSEGFSSIQEKEKEKRILFRNAQEPPPLNILEIIPGKDHSVISARAQTGETLSISIPFTDDASIQNAVTCWRVMLMLGYNNELIRERMLQLAPVNMRLEMKKGINHCAILNDSYSADLDSLEIALNFLDQQAAGSRKTVILSDFLQSSLRDEELYAAVLDKLNKHGVNRVVGIGEKIGAGFSDIRKGMENDISISLFSSTDEFIKAFRSSDFREETILVKGARVFSFERIVQLLELKVHQTVLEINLAAIVHNLREYQRLLHPATRVMAMVKAFAYGSGGAEIAGILQFHKIDYLGVAYTDEGVDLRKAGIDLPVMVMNPEENAFEKIVEYNLEPELYSFGIMQAFDNFLKNEGIQDYPVHIEMETGMNRLGFEKEQVMELSNYIMSTSSFRVRSVFSHLAASEEKQQDEFSDKQFQEFEKAASILQEKLGYSFIRHIANSAAVVRHPHMQLEMVRLGIGLYGVDSSESKMLNLQTVATLRSTIAQLKQVPAGESVSYNRRSIVEKDSVIATIRLGYADGYPRKLGNGQGRVWINGQTVPVIGTVCMDMFMVDVTGIKNVKEGDEVIIFGKELPVEEMAARAGTIPYEIMTGISQRVKRVYFEE